MTRMAVQVAVRKVDKYAVTTGGDSVEIIERPKGGISVVLADGQGSGPSAKKTSAGVVNTIIGLIGDGVRDGSAARAAHDKLFAARQGKVSSTLVIASADLHTQTIVISRNGNCPVFVWDENGNHTIYDEDIPSIGFHYEMKPQINEVNFADYVTVVAVSDGITSAGKRYNNQLKLNQITEIVEQGRNNGNNCDEMADEIINLAIRLDHKKAGDDMSVFVLTVGEISEDVLIREMGLTVPYSLSYYGKNR